MRSQIYELPRRSPVNRRQVNPHLTSEHDIELIRSPPKNPRSLPLATRSLGTPRRRLASDPSNGFAAPRRGSSRPASAGGVRSGTEWSYRPDLSSATLPNIGSVPLQSELMSAVAVGATMGLGQTDGNGSYSQPQGMMLNMVQTHMMQSMMQSMRLAQMLETRDIGIGGLTTKPVRSIGSLRSSNPERAPAADPHRETRPAGRGARRS
jgi:hypothetical protein